ncbi:hypothetical protein ABTD62_19830, partial [Acinetobacter baumannii]
MGSTQFPSPAAACKAYADYTGYTNPTVTSDGVGSYKYNCNVKNEMGNTAKIGIAERGDPTKCPVSGYPVPTYFEPNTPIPLRVCKQNP